MVNSALVFTRGPVVAVYSHNGTHEGTYDYEGTPCVWIEFFVSLTLEWQLMSSLLILYGIWL